MAKPTSPTRPLNGQTTERAPLVVIGAGPGGYAAAFKAAELGLSVTLIDPAADPGGACLYRGCIPSKSLLHVARLVTEAEEAAALGVRFERPQLDVDRIRAWKEEVIAKLAHGLRAQVRRHKVDYRRGRAQLIGARTLEITDAEDHRYTLAFDQAILATGSRPIQLPGVPEHSSRIVDSTGALTLPDVPDSLLVVGGGYIGLELGSVYAALGTRVTVVEMTAGLLPGVDRDLVSVLKRRLERRLDGIWLNTRVERFVEHTDRVDVTVKGRDGEPRTHGFDRVLIAIGRRPNTTDLGLEQAGITLDERGFVPVDGQRRTEAPHIFAIGDLAGEPMLAHKATAEAIVAAEAAADQKSLFDPRAIPAVVFTDPEIAWCGLTETEARASKRAVRTAKISWRGVGRTLTLGRDDGVTKLIVDAENDRILGVAMAGPGAGELIAEGVLAIEMAAVADDLRRTIHPHPTLSESVYESALALFRP